jgi:hypothetical protein
MTSNALYRAVLDSRTITGWPYPSSRIPAAFLVNMPWWRINNLLPQFKVYRPKTKHQKHKTK